jgi:uncharacterized protein with PIN domain
MVIITTNNESPYGTECIRCNDNLIAPDESQYVSERHVSHSWSCESCGHEFETSDHLDFNVPRELLSC